MFVTGDWATPLFGPFFCFGGGTVAGIGIGWRWAASCFSRAKDVNGNFVLHIEQIGLTSQKTGGLSANALEKPFTAQAHTADKADVDHVMMTEAHSSKVNRVLGWNGERLIAEGRRGKVHALLVSSPAFAEAHV